MRTAAHRPAAAQLEHLDGHKVQVGTRGVTRPGEVRWYQGEGMPRYEKVRVPAAARCWLPGAAVLRPGAAAAAAGAAAGWCRAAAWRCGRACPTWVLAARGGGSGGCGWACACFPRIRQRSPCHTPCCPPAARIHRSLRAQTTRGDLWVTFQVAFPKTLTDGQRDQLRQLFGGNSEWERRQLAHDEL